METIELIREILEENLDIDATEVDEDTSLDSLDIDSLDRVELVCSIEDRLDIDFGEPEDIETIGDLVSHIDDLR